MRETFLYLKKFERSLLKNYYAPLASIFAAVSFLTFLQTYQVFVIVNL